MSLASLFGSLTKGVENLDEQGNSTYKKVDAGIYNAKLRKAELFNSKTSEAKAWNLTYEVIDNKGEPTGQFIQDSIWLCKANGSKITYVNKTIAAKLMHLGLNKEQVASFKQPTREGTLGDWQDLIETEAPICVQCEEESYNGKTNVRVTKTGRVGSLFHITADEDTSIPPLEEDDGSKAKKRKKVPAPVNTELANGLVSAFAPISRQETSAAHELGQPAKGKGRGKTKVNDENAMSQYPD
jgi:hypothetical protein